MEAGRRLGVYIYPALCLLALMAFSTPALGEAYEEEILQWRTERLESLKAPTGYLNLVGLFPLASGRHSFGYAETDALRLTHVGTADSGTIGTLERVAETVTFRAHPGVHVTLDGERVSSVVMKYDRSGPPTVLSLGGLKWYVIQRGSQLLLRVRDLENRAAASFGAFEYFRIEAAWRIEATFEPVDEGAMIAVTNILGEVIDTPSTGSLRFELGGRTYRLKTSDEGDELFIVFGDATNGDTTYGSGRFVYVNKPVPGEPVVLDFNKAYNPPCAFSKYTTCPLPPEGNVLPIAVPAGERLWSPPEG